MPEKPESRLQFDEESLNELVCPACFGDLRLEEARLACTGCERVYPIVDGIPVLIAERALDADQASTRRSR